MDSPVLDRSTPSTLPLISVLVIILAAHLLIAWVSRSGVVQDDADSYVRLGQNLADGLGYVFEPGGHPTSWRAPGYPVYLSLVFKATGGSLEAARATHALMWALTAACVFFLARRTIGRDQAVIAAGLVGLYPECLGMTGLLWSENLFIPLFVVTVLTILAIAQDGPNRKTLGVLALIWPACVLTRSTALVLMPVVIWVVLRRRLSVKDLAGTAAALAIGLLAILAWTQRNWVLHRQFVLVESNVGLNLYAGNNSRTPIPFAWKALALLPEDVRYRELTNDRTEAEANRALTREALSNITEHPARTLALAAGKTVDFWLPDFFVARNLRSGSYGERWRSAYPVVLALTATFSLATMTAAFWHAFCKWKAFETRFFLVVTVAYMAPHLVVYGASRYRLPLAPLLIVLATPVFVTMAQRMRRVMSTQRAAARLAED